MYVEATQEISISVLQKPVKESTSIELFVVNLKFTLVKMCSKNV